MNWRKNSRRGAGRHETRNKRTTKDLRKQIEQALPSQLNRYGSGLVSDEGATTGVDGSRRWIEGTHDPCISNRPEPSNFGSVLTQDQSEVAHTKATPWHPPRRSSG